MNKYIEGKKFILTFDQFIEAHLNVHRFKFRKDASLKDFTEYLTGMLRFGMGDIYQRDFVKVANKVFKIANIDGYATSFNTFIINVTDLSTNKVYPLKFFVRYKRGWAVDTYKPWKGHYWYVGKVDILGFEDREIKSFGHNLRKLITKMTQTRSKAYLYKPIVKHITIYK